MFDLEVETPWEINPHRNTSFLRLTDLSTQLTLLITVLINIGLHRNLNITGMHE